MYTITCSNPHAKVRWKYAELSESLSKWALKCTIISTKLTIRSPRTLRFRSTKCLSICSQVSRITQMIWALSKQFSNLPFMSKIDIMTRFFNLSKTTSKNITMSTSNFMTLKITFTQTKIVIGWSRRPIQRTSHLSERGKELSLVYPSCQKGSLKTTSGSSLTHTLSKLTPKKITK